MNEITLPPIATPAVGTATQSAENRSVLSSDFEVFLQMLTAQARFQDPLDPVSSSDYAAQLAQFSMVEQQVLTNELIESLVSATSTTDQLNPPTWLGLEVEAETPVTYAGEPIEITASPPARADEMALMVYDASGNLIFEEAQNVSAGQITWFGLDNKSNGSDQIVSAPPGDYVVRVESRRNGTVVKTDTITGFAAVSEALLEGGQTTLLLENGVKVKTSDVTGMRNPTTQSAS